MGKTPACSSGNASGTHGRRRVKGRCNGGARKKNYHDGESARQYLIVVGPNFQESATADNGGSPEKRIDRLITRHRVKGLQSPEAGRLRDKSKQPCRGNRLEGELPVKKANDRKREQETLAPNPWAAD